MIVRYLEYHGTTPHISGTSLSAQARYAAGTRKILECWFDKRPIRATPVLASLPHLLGYSVKTKS